MRVTVINTGTELLLGNTLNTHLGFIARELLPLGLRVARQATVPDGEAIREALFGSFEDSDIVIVTGGLGPTTDDITREITAELLGLDLEHNPEIMAAISARAAARGFRLTDRIPRQAQVPAGAIVIPNENGTAPGLHLPPIARESFRSPHIFLLPGPPNELRPMVREKLIPILKRIVPQSASTEWRYYRLTGLGESLVEEAVGAELLSISELEVGYCARLGEVEVRVGGPAAAVGKADAIMAEKLGRFIFAKDETPLAEILIRALTARNETLAVAESCTGGLLANRLTDVPGASAAFLAGYVTYANEAKSDALGVNPSVLAAHGAVSEEVAREMAEGARRRSGAAYAFATTGTAGPGGGSEAKPVGTVFIALAADDGVTVRRLFYLTDRATFKQLATQAALEMLRQKLISREDATVR